MNMDTVDRKGVPSTTFKIEIRWYDTKHRREKRTSFFLHLLWNGEQLIGLKMDGLREFKTMNRALFREYCRELSERLQDGQIDLNYVCQRWIAQTFDPEGYCPQLEAMVRSPLDAAAKVLIKRYGLQL